MRTGAFSSDEASCAKRRTTASTISFSATSMAKGGFGGCFGLAAVFVLGSKNASRRFCSEAQPHNIVTNSSPISLVAHFISRMLSQWQPNLNGFDHFSRRNVQATMPFVQVRLRCLCAGRQRTDDFQKESFLTRAPSVAMARPKGLENRLRTILDVTLNRAIPNRSILMLGLLGFIAALLPIAMMRAADSNASAPHLAEEFFKNPSQGALND